MRTEETFSRGKTPSPPPSWTKTRFQERWFRSRRGPTCFILGALLSVTNLLSVSFHLLASSSIHWKRKVIRCDGPGRRRRRQGFQVIPGTRVFLDIESVTTIGWALEHSLWGEIWTVWSAIGIRNYLARKWISQLGVRTWIKSCSWQVLNSK